MTTDHVFTGRVTGLAFGGEGIVRHEGMVVFIPFTAPDDQIRFRILSQKKNFAHGELVEVLTPGPARTTPLCPYFGTCGGCQLQHLEYAAQLEYKHTSIQDAVHRIAQLHQGIVEPVHAATERWHYRRRVILTLAPFQEHFQAGYTAVDNRSLVAVNECVIFAEKNDPIVSDIQKVALVLDNSKHQTGKVTVLKNDDGRYLLHFRFEFLPLNANKVLQEALKMHSSWEGILVTARGKTLTFGTLKPKIQVDGMEFSFSLQAFIQNHPEQSLKIYRSIVEHAKAMGVQKVLDLYCGIGISSMMLAKHGLQVTGVESNREAVKMAQANAKNNGLEKQAHFVEADVQNVLPKLLKQDQPDLVVVNPPRTGLDRSVVEALIAAAPQTILYISCMPSTLARDLKLLCQASYRLEPVEAYDMFPQTAHVETLAILKR